MIRPPTITISPTKRTALPIATARPRSTSSRPSRRANTGRSTRMATVTRSSKIEPSDRDLAVRRLEPAVVHERPQQHDGAGDREGDAEQPRRRRPTSPRPGRARSPPAVTRIIWSSGARNRDPPDLPEVPEREVQADAEHQQDHAELGELTDGLRIAPESRRERPQRDARDEVADDRRQPDTPGQQAADQRVREDDADVYQERNVRHGDTKISLDRSIDLSIDVKPRIQASGPCEARGLSHRSIDRSSDRAMAARN